MPATKRREAIPAFELPGDNIPSLRAVPFGPGGTREPVQVLSKRQQEQLISISTRLHLPARTIVYREEAIANWIFIVARGLVKSFRDLPSGKRRIMAFLFARDVFGLSERGHYVNTTQSVTPVTLYRIELGTLTAMFRRDAELQFQFLCKVTHELREALQHRIVVARRDAVGRLAMFLQMLEEETAQQGGPGSHIEIPMSRSDTANYLDLSPEAISRATRTLERTGIVAFDGLHRARILDRSRFDKLASAV